MTEIQIPSLPATPVRIPSASFAPVNHWTVESGREYVAIDDLENFDPFFLSITGAGDHWLFCGSNGALSAGRRSPETALFPYDTVDKIIENWNCTGPWTAIVCQDQLWNPFSPAVALHSPPKRRLLKSPLGDEIVFDELHEGLGLRLSYRWQLSPRFGFVRTATLTNASPQAQCLRMIDGLDNFLPSGVDSRLQLQFSCLADAYKISELDRDGKLVIHRLAAGITDQPIPLESLRATTVWTHGLGSGPTYLDRRTAEAYLQGQRPEVPSHIRARRGAMLVARELALEPGQSVEWSMIAEIEQSQVQVAKLRQQLADPAALLETVRDDIQQGRKQLEELVRSADGFQQSADRDTTLYHYHNTLCNIMRGGVPEQGSTIRTRQFINYLANHNRPAAQQHADWLNALPVSLNREDLVDRIKKLGCPDLLRLAEEYLPLVLSRRHGDPSRPWNRFFIRTPDASGEEPHHFEGNWRDIFQNWEALAWSHPGFLDGFIAKFLNASTVDGFNPYRITSTGLDWEVPDPHDPWSSIGYWGDHQIVYLLKLLELEERIHPASLARRLDDPRYVFADVPYRLKSWADTLKDPRNTVDFDRARHDALMAAKEKIGGDGLLLRDAGGRPVRVTLAEKLLLPALVKLGNLVPGGGIWMNTQRPEWNDANNALAGCGLSVVTAAYLYRYVHEVAGLIAAHSESRLKISPAVATLVVEMDELFSQDHWKHQDTLDATERFALAKRAGLAIEHHRRTVYKEGPGTPSPCNREAVLALLKKAARALEGTLRSNRREDHLWHSYNILNTNRQECTMEIERLPVMLEGQVAILSSGILRPTEAARLLEALPTSPLRSKRHQSYTLYPDAETPPFLDFNLIREEQVRAIGTLAAMADQEDTRIIERDAEQGFRFHPDLTNAYALNAALDALTDDPDHAHTLHADRARIEALYESVFNHRLFTGRSGSMFGYEGLGSIYWHMVSKLMLAAQEVALHATEAGADPDVVTRLVTSYFEVQSGLGYRRPPREYGAFPAEPYSHSPSHSGAKQPGLTGQVKEGILCRMGELGVSFHHGTLSFRPRLLRQAEFAGLAAGPSHPALPEGSIAFTLARTPVTYLARDGITDSKAIVQLSDGSCRQFDGAKLDQGTTAEIVGQTGHVTGIEVEIPSSWLIA